MQMNDLNEYPQPAVLAVGGRVNALNDKARTLFSGLAAGDALPEVLHAPEECGNWEGCVTLFDRMYRVTATAREDGTLFLFRPQEQQALSEAQMDGALYQMRTLMGEFRRELAPYAAGERDHFEERDLADFTRSYYRMLRLMDHMDLLRDAAAGQVGTARERLELERLCADVAAESGALLREVGIEVEFEGTDRPVFVSGDGALLRDALLELISNCARRLQEGSRLKLGLKRGGKWVRVKVTDDGREATAGEKLGLTGRGTMTRIPAAGAGAGLGLSAVEAIVRLHGGALLVSVDDGAPSVYLALPLAERTGDTLSLRTPVPERNAGMNPYLIALADVLPGEMIREDWRD